MKVLPGLKKLLRQGPVHVTLIDPDKQSPMEGARIARSAQEGGTHFILIGGTSGVDLQMLDATIQEVKEATSLPIITFPASSAIISHHSHAILFMSLMNSSNVKYVIREASLGAEFIRDEGIEALSTGYVVVEPGMLVGKVGEVTLIPRNDLRTARGYALAAEMFGFSLFYLEGGSGVSEPVPTEMISSVREVLTIPLVVGGGIDTPDKAGDAVKAGADIIVTGNVVESGEDIKDNIRAIIKEMERRWKTR